MVSAPCSVTRQGVSPGRSIDLSNDARPRFRRLIADGIQDLRYGLRGMLRARAFALVTVLTLTLGIGATTAVFSVVNGALLAPFPYPHADRLVVLAESSVSMGRDWVPMSRENYWDWEASNSTFELMALFWGTDVTHSGADGAESWCAEMSEHQHVIQKDIAGQGKYRCKHDRSRPADTFGCESQGEKMKIPGAP